MAKPMNGNLGVRVLVLVSWISAALAAVPLVLNARMDGPLGALAIIGLVMPMLLLVSVFLLTSYLWLRDRKFPERPKAPRWSYLGWALSAAVVGALVSWPMLIQSRADPRRVMAQRNVDAVTLALAGAWDKARHDKVRPDTMARTLEAALAGEMEGAKNPYAPERPAFRASVRYFHELPDGAALGKAMESLDSELGCVVAGCQPPEGGTPGFLAAAVRAPGRPGSAACYVKVVLAE